ncbi:hypothetical protein [Nocardia sp. SC052]|uniref:hypothetical protein n=1 Tax=Nocardia sichangensis TaxID=3385975 RepID=UPI0039A2AF85
MFTTPALTQRDAIPAHWLARPWNDGDHRHILGDGRPLRAGELITVVWADRDGMIRAAVSMVLVPEHADHTVREASGFDSFAAARGWAETNDAELQDILDNLPWDADPLEAVTTA